MSWTIGIGELATLVCLLAIGLGLLRDVQASARQTRESGRKLDTLIERLRDAPAPLAASNQATALNGDLVSKLAVAVSVLVQHVEDTQRDDTGPDRAAIQAIRQSCLAIVEHISLNRLHDVYGCSGRRREALYKQATTVAELRDRIREEDDRLRQELDEISHRLEAMLDATQGRYAKADRALSAALERLPH
jgi:hypothetical protein